MLAEIRKACVKIFAIMMIIMMIEEVADARALERGVSAKIERMKCAIVKNKSLAIELISISYPEM